MPPRARPWLPSFFHLRAPGSPASTVTSSAVLSWSSRAPPRPSFAAVAHGHRCRGCRGRLCAWPGLTSPPLAELSGPMSVRKPLGAHCRFWILLAKLANPRSRCRRRGCRGRRWLTWSALHRQSSSEFGPPTGAAGHVDAPGPLLRRWRSPRRPESRAPANCSVSGRGMKLMDFALKFEKRGGPNCEVSDSCE